MAAGEKLIGSSAKTLVIGSMGLWAFQLQGLSGRENVPVRMKIMIYEVYRWILMGYLAATIRPLERMFEDSPL